MKTLCSRLALVSLVFSLSTMDASTAPEPFALLQSLLDPDTKAQTGALQGYSVAVEGNIAAVGVPNDDVGNFDSGVVKVYDVASGTLLHTLINPNPSEEYYFGRRVAVSGTRVVVGAHGYDRVAEVDAIGYVYELTSATPTVPIAALTNPSLGGSRNSTCPVAISGTFVVAGNLADDTGATYAGIAYVYDLTGANPGVPVLTLTNPFPALFDRFGNAAAISGKYVAVAAQYGDAGVENAGAVYVYDLRSADPMIPTITLTNPSPAAFDNFGYSLSMSGTRVVVGAVADTTGGPDAGGVYVFDVTSVKPTTPFATLTNPNPATSIFFGSSVAISGNLLVVGASYEDANATDAGNTYVYDLASATPSVPFATLNNPKPAAYDHFGHAVAVDGTTIVVGAPLDDTTADDNGAAYVFSLRPTLSLVSSAPGPAKLSWTPTNLPRWVLQYTDGLVPANWVNAEDGAANPATISTTNAARFYRLIHP